MKKINITPSGSEVVDMTAEEITIDETNVANAETKKTAEETAKTEKATAQASGNTKLLDLGLTQTEATSLTGYTPPEEE